MKRNALTRTVSLFLALSLLVGGMLVPVSAASTDNTTGQSIQEYKSKLTTVTYEEYCAKYADYFSGKTGKTSEELTFDATQNWVYSGVSGNVITYENGVWKMTVGDTVYNSLDEAVAAGYEKADLAYVTDGYGGVNALYTPNVGTVTWTLNMPSEQSAIYNIGLDYYPVAGKTASIEREFSINGEAPFSEARALTFAKIWAARHQNKTDELTATYDTGAKKAASLETVVEEAKAVGFVLGENETMWVKDNLVYFVQPEVVSSAMNAFLEKYDLRFFVTDMNENEIRSATVQAPEWVSVYLKDGSGYYTENFGFVLTPDGDRNLTFALEGVNETMALSKIVFKPYTETISYASYIENIKNTVGDKAGTDSVKIEAEYTYRTSTNVVYPVEDRTSALTSPADTTRTVLNTIGTEKWETAGQWVEYKFKVSSSGLYDISSRFKQSYLDGMYVCRALSLYTDYADADDYKAKFGNTAGYYNGAPFAEANLLRYNYGTEWQSTRLTAGYTDADGNVQNYEVYFEAGVEYVLRLEVTLGSMGEMVSKVETVLNSLNDDYLAIIKLTGTSPDDYRDYKFARLLPDTLIDMIKQAKVLSKSEKEDGKNAEDGISQFLKKNSGSASTYSGICDKLSNLLRKMAKDEEQLAKNLDNFKSYVGSLGTFLTDAKTQPLQIDYLVIQPSSDPLPKAKANFFVNFWHEICSFYQSFKRDYNSLGAMDNSETTQSINVWVPYGRDQANVIRNLSTNGFTQESGIAVDLKLVSGGTLLPSILAGIGPDVYLGLDQSTVINYAIRGALQNVETMDGFDEVEENFNDAAKLVLQIADADGDMHTYGLPEQQAFAMMFIRKDILANLGIEIPKTWEELYIAQSKLESNNMEIGVTTSYKVHLYQNGGNLFADDGMRINLDSQIGLTAFEITCNLFTQYSFPYSYDSANRFRTGEMPIILSDYTSLYNKLKVFATEIDGCWTFVPIPGYEREDENGNTILDNSAISSVTAVIMVSGKTEEQKTAAWKYMKWYTGADAQADYANEMVAIIGDSAKHSTANREALKSMPWTYEEYVEVSKQFENLASIPNYPGSYYIDRYTNFAFLSAYNDDADPSTELLSYINTINNEITRKREEFKLETLEIGQTLASKRMDQATEAIELLSSNFNSNGKYNEAIAAAKYGVANKKSVQLREASDAFEALLLANWNGKTKEITKVSGETVEKPSYYINVSKQTADEKNGGYSISSLKSDEQVLVYFISKCLADAADALDSY